MIRGLQMKENLVIYVLSDSIGETGELIARAAVRQFRTNDYEIRRFPYISSIEQIEKIFQDAINNLSVIIYTTVLEDNKNYIDNRGRQLNIPVVDVMGEPLRAFGKLFNMAPKREAGLIRRLDESYFNKVEAVEFAVKYDDGKDHRGIKRADICLVGVSRTSKTPLSMYLAHRTYKVANVPLVPEVPAPKEIYEKDVRRVIGLVANPHKLNEIRQERLKSLGLDYNANYASLERIRQELDYAKKVMNELGCTVIDVSNRAIEETASIIIEKMSNEFGN